VVAAAGVAAAAVAVVVVARSRHDGAGPPTGPGPPGYTITYRVEVTIDKPEVSRRVVAVRRPFDGSDRTTPAGQPGAETGLVARGGHLYRLDPDKAVDLGDQGPAVAPGDLRLGPELPILRRLGLARPRGSATVAGRTCRRWRFGAPVTDTFKAPTATEYADACIDADGLVLAEDWHLDGRRIRRTEAETVVTTPPGDEALSLGGRPVVSSAAVGVTTLPLDAPPPVPGSWWVASPAPDAFHRIVRYRSTTVEPGTGVPLAGTEFTADAYVAGSEAVWVEQRSGVPVQPPKGTGEAVRAGPLGAGWLWLTPQGPQVRVGGGDGPVTVVRGTVSPERLLAFTRSLKPVATGR